jgi:hypothetical protein
MHIRLGRGGHHAEEILPVAGLKVLCLVLVISDNALSTNPMPKLYVAYED